MSEWIVRKGERKDVGQLLKLIQELADYEKAPNEVIITEEILLKDGFGPDKIFDFYVADHGGEILGIALYYTKYSTWKGRCLFLEDIIVSEQHRRKGIGELLFKQVVEAAEKAGVKRLEWQVLDWNKPAIEFYKKHESLFEPEWINCKLTFP